MWRSFCAAMVLGSGPSYVPSTNLVSHWIFYESIASQLTHRNIRWVPCSIRPKVMTLQGHLHMHHPSELKQV